MEKQRLITIKSCYTPHLVRTKDTGLEYLEEEI
jgi:hypothetical protein